jgi:hypothetical protein
MGNENVPLQAGIHFFSNFFKPWRILNRFIIDACESLYVPWY